MMWNYVIHGIFRRKEEIIEKTTEFQKIVIENTTDRDLNKNGVVIYNKVSKNEKISSANERLMKYFQTFTSDELKVIRSIEHFGTECCSGESVLMEGDSTDAILYSMCVLYSVDDFRRKRELKQISYHANRVGTYFLKAFEDFEIRGFDADHIPED